MLLEGPARDTGSQEGGSILTPAPRASEHNPPDVDERRGREGLREPVPGQTGVEDTGLHGKGDAPANNQGVPRGLEKLTGLQRELFLSFQAGVVPLYS
jgi:hypothetical protein